MKIVRAVQYSSSPAHEGGPYVDDRCRRALVLKLLVLLDDVRGILGTQISLQVESFPLLVLFVVVT